MKRAIILCFVLFSIILSGCAAHTSSPPNQLRPTTLQTVTDSYQYYTEENCSEAGPQGFEPLPPAGMVLAGATAHTSYSVTGGECATTVFFYRAGTLFDLSQLGSQPVTRTMLSFRLISSETEESREHVSCASELRLATTTWQDFKPEDVDPNAPSFALPVVDFGSAAQPTPTPGVQIDLADATISVDVTQAVNDWLSNRWPNNGLLLGSGSNGYPLGCLSRYTDFSLEITR